VEAAEHAITVALQIDVFIKGVMKVVLMFFHHAN
jgi:hypothetical protein